MMADKYRVTTFTAGNCYSYMVSDSGQAVIIDPHLTLADKYDKALRRRGTKLIGIVDTHTHADHVSSAAILKDRHNVPLYMGERADSAVATDRLAEGDTIDAGQTKLTALYTPGHTDDAISLLSSRGDVFTGDVLLIDSVGRTDFQNGSPESMFDSLRKLAALPGETVLRPAHDYNGNKTSTIAAQRESNPFLREQDKTRFCQNARSKTLAKPASMDTIIAANQQGSAKALSAVPPAQAHGEVAAGKATILDVRGDDELREISVVAGDVKHIPLQSLGRSMDSLPHEQHYYILCRSGERADMAAMALMQHGFMNVAMIDGGILAWAKAGLPVKKAPTVLSLERQIRTLAGCLVVVGALLALVSPWFLIIPLWVGAGLAFAGLSGHCFMAMLLMKLPYNKKALTPGGGTCSMDGGTCSM